MKIEFENRIVNVPEKYAKSLIARKKAKEVKAKPEKKQSDKDK